MSFLPFLFFLGIIHVVSSIESSPHGFREIQPDGSPTPQLRMVGGPKLHYVTDANGFTVIEDDNRWYVYAGNGVDRTGRLESSGVRVGMGNPEKQGIHKGVIPAVTERKEDCGHLCDYYDDRGRRQLSSTSKPTRNLGSFGVLKNLVVLLRFSDHQNRSLPSEADIDVLMNKVGGDPNIAPTGSVRDVYTQSSYDQLHLDSTVYTWITLPNTEHYYADDANGFTDVFVEALHDALDQMNEDPNFSFQDFDVDGDGTIDAITFLHSGYGAEWGGTDCNGSGMSQRIWSHKWTMPSRFHWFSNDGVRVNKYHISPALWGRCGSEIGRIGVIAHELGHFLGLPDLYDGSGGEGVGSYDLMANSWGFDGSQRYPPTLSSWSKVELGWATPTTLTTGGEYSLEASGNVPAIYRVDRGFPSGEYLLIENRQNIGFDAILPQGGLAVWHIDESAGYNEEGHPGQTGWPGNGKHYKVALMQADGKYDLEKGVGRGDAGDLWHRGGNREIGPSGSLEGPFPNTDAYQGGQTVKTGIRISGISEAKQQMTFQLSFGENPTPPPVESPTTAAPTSAPSSSTTRKLLTTFAGGNGQAGNQFDVVATKHIAISSFSIHTSSTSTVTVEVFTKRGSHVGYENDSTAWEKITETTVTGQGAGKPTPLPPRSFEPVRVNDGDTQAFYITLTTPDMRYSEGGKLGNIFASNSDLQILEGIGLKYPFGLTYSPRVWNGVMTYDLMEEPVSHAPTSAPTQRPTRRPTGRPTESPTAAPSAAPTAAPSVSPTHQPSAFPSTTPSAYPSSSPSAAPTTATAPTKAKTLATKLDATTGQAGNMFDIVASKDIAIQGLSIHTSKINTVEVEVWTKEGSYQGYEDEAGAWTQIAATLVQGKGRGELTQLPDGCFDPVKISASGTQAFYVTLTTSEIRYSRGKKLGSVVASNDDLSLLEGVGKKYNFGPTFANRIWNGEVKYALQDDMEQEGRSISPTTLAPTATPTSPSELLTTMEGGNGQAGNMWNILAMNNIAITGMNIHTKSTDTVEVEVWTKAGSYKGFEKNPSAWTQIAKTTVLGRGKGNLTPLPPNSFDPVRLDASQMQSFYVTLTTDAMRYTNGDDLGAVYASNSDIKFFQGVGKAYPFKGTYEPRIWNGVLLYSVRD